MSSKRRNARKSHSLHVGTRQSSVGGARQSTISSALRQEDVAIMPDSSGANYISSGDLHLDPGTQSGKTRASERVPYKPLKGLAGKSEATSQVIGNPTEQVNKPEPGSKVPLNPEGYGPSFTEGIDTIAPVARDLNPVERKRQLNNRTRDARTALGHGKPSQPTVE